MNLHQEQLNKNSYKTHIGDMTKLTNLSGLCVTTNGYVNKQGKCVMGRGIAKQIADTYPDVPTILGNLIKYKGNRVYILKAIDSTILLSFPVKPITGNIKDVVPHLRHYYKSGTIPGFAVKAQLSIIEESFKQLVKLVEIYKLNRVTLPLVGCGAGELSLKDVKPLFDKYLDSRFIICSFKESDFNY